MLAAFRRCPASLPRSISTSVIAPRLLRPAQATSTSAWRSTISVSRVSVASLHQSNQWRQHAAERYVVEAEVEQEVNAKSPPSDGAIDNAVAGGPVTKFEDLATRGYVHKNIVNTLTKDMGLHTMTEVQTRTINEALKGADIIAQAKTGTGKTLGFLLPVLQNIISKDPGLATRGARPPRTTPGDIRAIIISPTRELAEQIAVEARTLTRNTGVVVQVGVGGTQKRMMLQQIKREGCHILIGTPGRLNDLLSDEYSGVEAPKLSALVMDEADRLLDDGFTREINEIRKYLPDPKKQDRQTLMFSATVPKEVVGLVRQTLKPGFHFVKCVRDDEEATHERIPQKLVHAKGLENMMPALFELCTTALQSSQAGDTLPFKAIVYFNSTAEASLASNVFRKIRGSDPRQHALHPARVFEIHGKLNQGQRTRAADDFRNSKSGILLSSDVTARGMDFPNVTHVIQVGVPRERETYIHRIGRTGRAGKEGEGWIITSPLDSSDVRRRLHSLPLKNDTSLETASVDMSREAQLPEDVATILSSMVDAYRQVHREHKTKVYMAYLGVYQGMRDKHELIDSLNGLTKHGWGMDEAPKVGPSLARKLGLNRVPGINIGSEESYESSAYDSQSSFSRRGSDSGYSRSGGGGYQGRSSGGDRGGYQGSSRGGSPREGGYRGGDRGGYQGSSQGGGGYQGNSRGGFQDRSSPRPRGGERETRGRNYDADF
ncbi:DEAD-domain-containing protein [Lophium mytilinum]|uniref:ATP-dependent RNA helicase n=1 Tax=Lophium mytilinum TaxID=390894 RepID=A0A6A6QMA7_9PEZI|nr:DEAD-domain-containing protein [Lophium mytilinum]